MKKSDALKLQKASKVIHVGGEPDNETGAIMPPIFQTSTYVQSSPGTHKGYAYSRSHNPTRTRLEENLASLENAKYALVTSSGMASEMLIMHALKKGSTVVCSNDCYGGTYRLFETVFNELHNFIYIDTTDIKLVRKTLTENKVDLLWIETPTNPLLRITDLKEISKIAKENKTKTVVDNTFMSPIFQNPLDLGVDVVTHSMTKYINGHSDVVGGCIMLNNKAFYNSLHTLQKTLGPTQSPFDSWLVLRGIKTLHIRMKAHEENAKQVAKYLDSHPKIEKVLYPGLKSHPQHGLARKQMNGFGGMVSFYLKGDLKKSKKLLSRFKVFSLAESLGGIESLIGHPAIMTHASVPEKERNAMGISDNLIRISVGIEDIKDLIQDLDQALEKV